VRCATLGFEMQPLRGKTAKSVARCVMYIPEMFAENDRTKLFDFIEANSFGILVSEVAGQPFATHMPFLVDRDAGPHGTLIGHVARANPHWKDAAGQTGLAIFSGPHVYVSPTWYESEHVVPTWNYTAVHVYGTMRMVEDEAGLADIVGRMVAFYERSMPTPWTFDDKTTFMSRMLGQIVGVRIEIERIEGKFKLNQNRTVEQRERVAAQLERRDDENSAAIAALMRAMLPE
jgi:transcriptional regulator